MIEALKVYDPETPLVAPDFRSFLIAGFPWHNPELSHKHITTSEAWWGPIINKFVEGYVHYGISDEQARKLALLAKKKFLDMDTWNIFDDTIDTLNFLSELGWKHAIVSNHMPELIDIVKALGIDKHIEYFINSAFVGYEKPNRMIYEYALSLTGRPKEVWMIGDNIEADYFGAHAAGIKAILVRNKDPRAEINCKDLKETLKIIIG